MAFLGQFRNPERSRRLSLAAVLASLMFGIGAPVFAAPAIFYTDIVSGPNTGGENNNGAYLTIFGTGFGTVQGTGTVTVGGGAVAAYKVWSDNKVAVQIGPAAATGNIVINTAAGSATALDTFTVRPGKFFFVSLTGVDGSAAAVNDITKPYRSLNFVNGLSTFVAGDFIVVRGGTYNMTAADNVQFGSWWRVNKSGTAGNPLTVMGYPGEDVIMHTTSAVSLVGTTSQSTVTNFVAANFKVWIDHCISGNIGAIGAPRGTDNTCVGQVRAQDVRLVNWDIDGKGTGGMCSGFGDNIFEIGYSDRVKVLGMSVHDTSPALGQNEASHILYSTATQTDTEWGWNHVYNIPAARAIIQIHTDNVNGACYGTKRLTNIRIHDNLLNNVPGQAILMDGGTGDIAAYNNVIYSASTTNRYEDVIALRGSGGTLNAALYNNTLYVNPGSTDVGWALGIGSVDYGPAPCPQTVTVRNNIFYVTETQDRYFDIASSLCNSNVSTIVTSSNNVWFGSSQGLPSFAGAGDIVADPLFVNAPVANFTLTVPGSPAIDAGTSAVNTVVKTDFKGNPRPQGTGYDVGAFESSGASLPAPQNLSIIKQ